MLSLLLLALSANFPMASAQMTRFQKTPGKPYDCHAAIIAKDVKQGAAEFRFEAPVLNQSTHGGPAHEFAADGHRIYVVASGKWRAISWWRGQELVAETVTASKSFLISGHTLIVYNPKDTNEQAYLVCYHDQLDVFPNE